MLFDDEFIALVQTDPTKGASTICHNTIKEVEDKVSSPTRFDKSVFDTLIESYSYLKEIIDSNSLEIQIPIFDENSIFDRDDLQQISKILFLYFKEIATPLSKESVKLEIEQKMQSYRSKFRTSLGNGFSYQFSQGDLERIQVLLNELRDLVSISHQLDNEHKQRLISRLEKMQSEIHKKVSDLDRFWGLVGDAGVVIGKLAEDSKPIVDRIREITNIIWRTQVRAEELPSGTGIPLLGQKSLDSEDT